ncbi:hypothetical protein CH063_16045, partial [Colletotrichum higginsianum]
GKRSAVASSSSSSNNNNTTTTTTPASITKYRTTNQRSSKAPTNPRGKSKAMPVMQVLRAVSQLSAHHLLSTSTRPRPLWI